MTFIVFIHLVGAAYAIHAIMHASTASSAIAWSISLLTFPYLALPFYWIFGQGKFYEYRDALRRSARSNEEQLRTLLDELNRYRAELPESMGETRHVLESLVGVPFLKGNEGTLLIDGEETFREIFSAIEQAREYVLLAFYIVRDDALGRELLSLLRAKRKEGVRVFFLFDRIGSYGLGSRYIKALREAGVDARSFISAGRIASRWRINFRNHRKITVVDGRVAFVGGHNIGVEYRGENPRFGPWRDTHLKLRGPVVQALQLVFVENWVWATLETPELRWDCEIAASEEVALDALVFPTGPADDLDTCAYFFLQAINAARKRLWIASAYFVPDEAVSHALRLAALRGVDVRILLPSTIDHIMVYHATLSYFPEMIDANVRMFRYLPGFQHQKVLLMDDDLACVGTANLDNRSFRLNFEVGIVVANRGFAGAVESMLEADFKQCRELTQDEYRGRGLPRRIAARICRLFAPVL